MGVPLLALIPAAIAGVSAIVGASNKRKAERERQRLAASRPQLQGSEFIDEQIDLSRSELSRGQTAGQNAASQMMDANFSSAIDALLKSGGSPGNMADLYGQQQTGVMRMALANDEIRRANIQNLMRAGQGAEGFRQQQFQFNSAMPWMDNSQANSAALQGANQQMWSGIANAGSSLSYGLGSMQNQANYNNYFKPPAQNLPAQSPWTNAIQNPYLR